MAKNNLTTEQDILTRRFYKEVAERCEAQFPNTPAHARQLRALVLDMLGYQVLSNGARVCKTKEVSYGFGNPDLSKFPDEWNTDLRARAEEYKRGTNNSKDTNQASTRKPGEDT